ncbi:hypothetical protein BH23CHL2_BH23CHL2_23130 [soil metagenome]
MRIRLRAPVIAADGSRVGRVERVLIERPSLRVRHLIVGGRLPTANRHQVPFEHVGSRLDEEERVQLTLSQDAVQALPDYVDPESSRSAARSGREAPRVTSFSDLSAPHIGSGPQDPGAMVDPSDSGESANPIALSQSTDLISRDGRNLGRLADIECDENGQLLALVGRGRIFQYGEVRIHAREIASCTSRQIHITLNASEVRPQAGTIAERVEAGAELEADRVEEIMMEPVDTIPASEPARHALRRMEAGTRRSLLVEENQRFLGAVIDRDLRRLPQTELDRPVGEFVQRDVPLLKAAMPLAEVRTLVAEMSVMLDHLPVVDDDGQLVGMVLRRSVQESETPQQQAVGSSADPEASVAKIGAGMRVEGPDGARIGSVEQVLTDGATATAIIIAHGLFGRRHTQLGVEHVAQVTPEKIVLTIGRREVKLLPDLDD